MSRSTPRSGALLLTLLLVPAWALPAGAQSILSAGGLGFPADPLGARARALGSLGVGLSMGTILPTDPAAAVGVPLPTVIGTLQPTMGTIEGLGPQADLTTTRFPLFGLAYPVTADKVVTVTVGSYLDQNWALNVDGSVELAGETVGVTDAFTSEGGVSSIQVGWAQAIRETVTVGFMAGLHVGELSRSFTRTFDQVGVGREVESFERSRRWRLSGPTASFGVAFEPVAPLRLSGSVTWSGDLDAKPAEDSEGESRTFPLPLEYRLGAMVSLTSELGVHASLSHADWSETGRALAEGSSVGGVTSVGGGVEWSGFRLLSRTVPLRLGVRHSSPPFRLGNRAPSELVFSGGLGINLVESEDGVPLASFDFSMELGDREAGAVKESFTRLSASLRVSGS